MTPESDPMPFLPIADTIPLASSLVTKPSATKATSSPPAAPAAASTSATAASTRATGAALSTSASETQEAADRFLTLLVTQLRNQDPLNPLDNAQVTTQLAQISTVSGINKLNDTVAALAASFAANQYLQAVGLVGHEVVVAGSQLALVDQTAKFGVALAGPADKLTVTIKDAAGNVVRTLDLGAQQSGLQTFTWDGKNDAGGKAAPGQYTIEVKATAKGADVAADPLMIAKVTGVARTDTGAVLMLAGLGNVALTDVITIQ